MHNSQIILISVAIAVVGIRLYQKYVKNGKSKSGTDVKSSSGTSMPSSSKDEDYEPYSKK
jgi:hypothetical protein